MKSCANAPDSGVTGELRPASGVVGRLLASCLVLCTFAAPAAAQSSVSPSADWNASYGFSGSADRSVRLIQSDLIRKGEGDYYDRLSDTYSVTNHVTNTTEIGQQTTTIGSINTATNNLDISGSGNALDLENSSTNGGCLNGSITIDSRPGLEGMSC